MRHRTRSGARHRVRVRSGHRHRTRSGAGHRMRHRVRMRVRHRLHVRNALAVRPVGAGSANLAGMKRNTVAADVFVAGSAERIVRNALTAGPVVTVTTPLLRLVASAEDRIPPVFVSAVAVVVEAAVPDRIPVLIRSAALRPERNAAQLRPGIFVTDRAAVGQPHAALIVAIPAVIYRAARITGREALAAVGIEVVTGCAGDERRRLRVLHAGVRRRIEVSSRRTIYGNVFLNAVTEAVIVVVPRGTVRRGLRRRSGIGSGLRLRLFVDRQLELPVGKISLLILQLQREVLRARRRGTSVERSAELVVCWRESETSGKFGVEQLELDRGSRVLIGEDVGLVEPIHLAFGKEPVRREAGVRVVVVVFPEEAHFTVNGFLTLRRRRKHQAPMLGEERGSEDQNLRSRRLLDLHAGGQVAVADRPFDWKARGSVTQSDLRFLVIAVGNAKRLLVDLNGRGRRRVVGG